MTEADLQEEAQLLALACAQIGNELAKGQLAVAEQAHRHLGVILKKFAALQEAAAAHVKPNGHLPAIENETQLQ